MMIREDMYDEGIHYIEDDYAIGLKSYPAPFGIEDDDDEYERLVRRPFLDRREMEEENG